MKLLQNGISGVIEARTGSFYRVCPTVTHHKGAVEQDLASALAKPSDRVTSTKCQPADHDESLIIGQ